MRFLGFYTERLPQAELDDDLTDADDVKDSFIELLNDLSSVCNADGQHKCQEAAGKIRNASNIKAALSKINYIRNFTKQFKPDKDALLFGSAPLKLMNVVRLDILYVRDHAPDLYTDAFGDPVIASLQMLKAVLRNILPHVQNSPKSFDRQKLNILAENAEQTLLVIRFVYSPSLLSSDNKRFIDDLISEVKNKLNQFRDAASHARGGLFGSSSSSSYSPEQTDLSSNDGCMSYLVRFGVAFLLLFIFALIFGR